jgi:hypothetical protein
MALDEARKRFWSGFWRETVEDAAIEYRMDEVRFGPVLALLAAGEPEDASVNLVLGAGAAGAVEQGHLDDALRWLESHEVRYRVLMTSGQPEAAGTGEWLKRRGQRLVDGPDTLVRDVSAPRFDVPAGVGVYERDDYEDEGIGDALVEGLGMPCWTSTTFMGLCGADGWRCYCSARGEDPLTYVAMSVDSDIAMLALASWPGETRDGDGQAAVLHRCIAVAAAAGCSALAVADAGQELAGVDREGLVRAGFEERFTNSAWGPRARVAA